VGKKEETSWDGSKTMKLKFSQATTRWGVQKMYFRVKIPDFQQEKKDEESKGGGEEGREDWGA